MSNVSTIEKKYNVWIVILSIAIPLVVAVLFTVKIPNVAPLSFLPPIYAGINALTAILLVWAVMAVKNGNRTFHERPMKVCIGLSVAFLAMYVAYHMTSESTKFVYLFIYSSFTYFTFNCHYTISSCNLCKGFSPTF